MSLQSLVAGGGGAFFTNFVGELLLRLFPSAIVRKTSTTPKKQLWMVMHAMSNTLMELGRA